MIYIDLTIYYKLNFCAKVECLVLNIQNLCQNNLLYNLSQKIKLF